MLVVLSMYYREAPLNYLKNLNLLYHSFSIILVIDTILKLITYGLNRYISFSWRKMEFIFTLHAIGDAILDYLFNWFEIYATMDRSYEWFLYLRIFFILRDLRMVLIIQDFIVVIQLKFKMRREMSFFFFII